MRVSGRQKGAKIKPYTHVVVNPNAPQSQDILLVCTVQNQEQKLLLKNIHL